MPLNLNETFDFAVATVRAAGGLLREYYQNGVVAEYKGVIDLVTDADRASEQFILERIRSTYPEHAILAEESGANGRASAYTWIADPLDGTTNFAHGFPVFSVTMALQVAGATELGVTYDPLRDELFTARRGQGARLNDRPIHVSATPVLDRSLLTTGFPYDRRTNPHNNLQQFGAFTLKSHGVLRAGSAALDLASVACGRVEGYWEFRLNPWDLSAGILMVGEAGGRVTDPSGELIRGAAHDVVASNGQIHDEMLAVLRSFRVA